MTTQANNDARAWTAATIDDSTYWYYHLSGPCLAALQSVRCDRRGSRPLADVRLPGELRAACIESLGGIRDALETGRGFTIIRAPDVPRDDLPLLYWLVGQSLGEPMTQNVQGTMLYDVRDTGQDLSRGARFSVTNYESSFHTDNSFGVAVLDYVGLLCVNVAKSGGRSQIVSGISVHNMLRADHPDVLETLQQPFHVDRRGGIREGETSTIEVPVFAFLPSPSGRRAGGEDLLVRYLRYWIEAGHEKIGQPLTPAQTHALNVLDECLNRRELRVEFDLKPGDMYFINNRWTLHNRTAFDDHAEPERRRHLARLWLARRLPV